MSPCCRFLLAPPSPVHQGPEQPWGAEVLIPVEDQFYGDRSGRLEDPFGHKWIVSTHKEDVSPEEARRRFQVLLEEMSSD